MSKSTDTLKVMKTSNKGCSGPPDQIAVGGTVIGASLNSNASCPMEPHSASFGIYFCKASRRWNAKVSVPGVKVIRKAFADATSASRYYDTMVCFFL